MISPLLASAWVQAWPWQDQLLQMRKNLNSLGHSLAQSLAEVVLAHRLWDHPLTWPLLQTLGPRLWQRHRQLSLRLRYSDCFVDVLHNVWVDVRCNVLDPSQVPSCSFLLRTLDCVRNPPNESLRKVHVALSCSYQQLHGSFFLPVGQVDRKCRDFNAIFESMITRSKVGVLC